MKSECTCAQHLDGAKGPCHPDCACDCHESSDLTALNKRQAKEGVERLKADLKALGEIKADGIAK